MAFKATKDSISTTTFEGITIQAIGLTLGYLDLKNSHIQVLEKNMACKAKLIIFRRKNKLS